MPLRFSSFCIFHLYLALAHSDDQGLFSSASTARINVVVPLVGLACSELDENPQKYGRRDIMLWKQKQEHQHQQQRSLTVLWAGSEDGYWYSSHYTFGPPYPWQFLDSDFQETYIERFHEHGIAWEYGVAKFNAIIPAIIDDLFKTTGIYVNTLKAKAILTELIGDRQPIAVLEKLGWSDDNKVIYNTCKAHNIRATHCAYESARRMATWVAVNESIIEASGFETTPHSIIHHADLNDVSYQE
ncbi:hypothetical protein KQX54_021433 [Cotesia glomerata]|uniref:Uncharacterized protein n=1 Tax=Cotesia glomerata TaxID=32391 RepID=A0AAV7IVY5_COTGL|nr:hypothetical protein KQX54_021433 [Cotesia glomerata]